MIQDMNAWFQALADRGGPNLSILYDQLDRTNFLWGLWTTVWLSVACIALSLAIGVLGAAIQGSRVTVLRWLVGGYIALFRNTPPLIQLYFFYFAVGAALPAVRDAHGAMVPPVSGYGWAIISFSFFAGAFNVEIFRAGVEAVPHETIEAAESLGYSRLGAYRHVVLPLALRVSLPALGNNLVNLVKTTTLAYAIAVPELLYVSAQIWSDQLNVREMMNVLLLVYLLLVAALVRVMTLWERRLRMPGFGQ